MESIKIQIPSLIENIRMIESFIDNAKEKYHISDDVYGNIMIAVTEAVSNAIKHGNKENKNKSVTILLKLETDNIKFTIEDEGEGFDFHNLPDPTAPENINNPGGRGIFIMKALSDELSFEEEGKIIQLNFKTPSKS